jgi:hypothetical protein
LTVSIPTIDRLLLEEVKIIGLTTGLRIDSDVLEQLGGGDKLTVHEYATTGGITLALDEGVLVNAPFDEQFCAASPLRLIWDRDALVLQLADRRVPVRSVVPLPGYLDQVAPSGAPVTATTMSHADRIRVSPISGCVYDCHFCDLGTRRYHRHPVEDVLASIDVAAGDTSLPPRHLLISGGSPARPPEHQLHFEESCLRIIDHVRDTLGEKFEVDIMMSASTDGPVFVDRLIDAGASGLSLNIEAYSEDASVRHLPLKHRFARPHLEAMIRRAVERLGYGTGRVRSLIIPGIEPPEATLEGVEWLASLGCSPVLSPFRPSRGTVLAAAPPLSPAVLRSVLAGSRTIAQSHDVPLGPRCVPCQHNTLTFPWDVYDSPIGSNNLD